MRRIAVLFAFCPHNGSTHITFLAPPPLMDISTPHPQFTQTPPRPRDLCKTFSFRRTISPSLSHSRPSSLTLSTQYLFSIPFPPQTPLSLPTAIHTFPVQLQTHSTRTLTSSKHLKSPARCYILTPLHNEHVSEQRAQPRRR